MDDLDDLDGARLNLERWDGGYSIFFLAPDASRLTLQACTIIQRGLQSGLIGVKFQISAFRLVSVPGFWALVGFTLPCALHLTPEPICNPVINCL
jgi:hypothetical protein